MTLCAGLTRGKLRRSQYSDWRFDGLHPLGGSAKRTTSADEGHAAIYYLPVGGEKMSKRGSLLISRNVACGETSPYPSPSVRGA